MSRLLPAAAVAFAAAAVLIWHLTQPARPPIAPSPRTPSRPRSVVESRPSAEAVATRFLTGLTLRVIRDDRRRDAEITRYADARHAAALRRQYRAEAERLQGRLGPGRTVMWAALLAHRSQRISRDRVAVDVWAVSVGGAGRTPVAVGWVLVRVNLLRQPSGWRVTTVEQRPAPDLAVTAARLASTTAGFRGYRVAP